VTEAELHVCHSPLRSMAAATQQDVAYGSRTEACIRQGLDSAPWLMFVVSPSEPAFGCRVVRGRPMRADNSATHAGVHLGVVSMAEESRAPLNQRLGQTLGWRPWPPFLTY